MCRSGIHIKDVGTCNRKVGKGWTVMVEVMCIGGFYPLPHNPHNKLDALDKL